MSAATGTLQTYQAVGNREDLSDLISNIAPTDVPFQNGAGKGSAKAVKFEWQTDALAPADTANAQIEGDDITSYETSTPTVRVGNYTQISRKTAVVSGTQDSVQSAGRKSEMAYQMVKRTKELRRDMEAILLSNQASTDGATGTARKTGGIRAWLKTNTELGASPGANGGYSAGIVAAATDGVQRPLTEALFKSVLLKCFGQGGDPDTLMLGPFNKQVASSWTGGQTKMQDTTNQKLVAAIDIYKSDFGTVKIVPNRFQRARDGLVLQMDLWKVAFLRAVQPLDLAKTGDAIKKAIIAEYGLQAMNEAGSGCIADLTTS